MALPWRTQTEILNSNLFSALNRGLRRGEDAESSPVTLRAVNIWEMVRPSKDYGQIRKALNQPTMWVVSISIQMTGASLSTCWQVVIKSYSSSTRRRKKLFLYPWWFLWIPAVPSRLLMSISLYSCPLYANPLSYRIYQVLCLNLLPESKYLC